MNAYCVVQRLNAAMQVNQVLRRHALAADDPKSSE
jgi:hypothetical protein